MTDEVNAGLLATLGITREDVLDRIADKILDAEEGGMSCLYDQAASVAKRIAEDEARKAVNDKLSSILDGLVDIPFTPVDEWGEPKADASTLRELIKRKALTFMEERVDKDGKPSTYGGNTPRGEWMARKAAYEAMDFQVKQEICNAVAQAKAELKQRVASFITEKILEK